MIMIMIMTMVATQIAALLTANASSPFVFESLLPLPL